MAEALILRLRRPGLRTVSVAAGLGMLGAVLQYAMNGASGPLAPWRIGCLLTVLGLWSWAAMEGSVVAHARRGASRVTFLAQVFAYGYFLSVSLVLMQLGQVPLVQAWTSYGLGGLLFVLLMASAMTGRDVSGSDAFFEHEHALDRNTLSRALFLTWPVLSLVTITFMVTRPVHQGHAPDVLAVLMVLFAGIWPLPYDISRSYRPAFVSFMVLGLILLLMVLTVP
ncbi:MAG: hypothetical protein AAF891_00300 [Pseudomonadota bacterium]